MTVSKKHTEESVQRYGRATFSQARSANTTQQILYHREAFQNQLRAHTRSANGPGDTAVLYAEQTPGPPRHRLNAIP